MPPVEQAEAGAETPKGFAVSGRDMWSNREVVRKGVVSLPLFLCRGATRTHSGAIELPWVQEVRRAVVKCGDTAREACTTAALQMQRYIACERVAMHTIVPHCRQRGSPARAATQQPSRRHTKKPGTVANPVVQHTCFSQWRKTSTPAQLPRVPSAGPRHVAHAGAARLLTVSLPTTAVVAIPAVATTFRYNGVAAC